MKIQQTKAEKLLRELGVNGSYVGFQYTAYGIIRTMEEPEMIVYVCKGLYVEIAAHFHTTRESAERNIRTVKNVIWKHGDKELLHDIFGRTLTKIPNNAAFIDALAQYLLIRDQESVQA